MEPRMRSRDRRTDRTRLLFLALLSATAIVVGCTLAVPTPAPTWTPVPTWTPEPTFTPTPFPTPMAEAVMSELEVDARIRAFFFQQRDQEGNNYNEYSDEMGFTNSQCFGSRYGLTAFQRYQCDVLEGYSAEINLWSARLQAEMDFCFEGKGAWTVLLTGLVRDERPHFEMWRFFERSGLSGSSTDPVHLREVGSTACERALLSGLVR